LRLPWLNDCGITVSVRTFFISLVAGILIWGAICLVAIAYQSSHAGSVMANIEIGLALALTIVACFVVRLR